MKFKDKKEYYSLRKFKGVGLASALVGLAFLAPNVMAEETATVSATSGDVSLVKSVDESTDSTIVVSKSSVEKSFVEKSAPEILEPNVVSVNNDDVKPDVDKALDKSQKFEEDKSLETKIDNDKTITNNLTDTDEEPKFVDSETGRSRRGKRSVDEASIANHGKLIETDDHDLDGWIGELYEDGTYAVKSSDKKDVIKLNNGNYGLGSILDWDPVKLGKIKKIEVVGNSSFEYFDLITGAELSPTVLDMTGVTTLTDKATVPLLTYGNDTLEEIKFNPNFGLSNITKMNRMFDKASKLKLTDKQVSQLLKNVAFNSKKGYNGPLWREIGVERLDLSSFDNSKWDAQDYRPSAIYLEHDSRNTKAIFKDLIGLKEVVFGDKFDFEKYARKNTPDAFMDTDLSGVEKVTFAGNKPNNDKFVKDWLGDVEKLNDNNKQGLYRDGKYVGTVVDSLNVNKTYEDGVYTLGPIVSRPEKPVNKTSIEIIEPTIQYVGDTSYDLGYEKRVDGENGSKSTIITYEWDDATNSYKEKQLEPIVTQAGKTIVTLGTKPKVVTENIEPKVVYAKDSTREKGSENVTETGKAGTKVTTTTYTVNEKTGKVEEHVGQPVVTEGTNTVVKVAAQDKVTYVKKGNDVVKVTTVYTVNETTGAITEKSSEEVVTKDGAKDKVVKENIEPKVVYAKDSTREKGSEDVTETGKAGTKVTTITYTVNEKTGKVEEHVGQPVVTEGTNTVVKVAAQDKVTYVKKGNDVVKVTTVYTVNETTGAITEKSSEEVVTKDGAKDKVVKENIEPKVVYSKDSTREKGSENVTEKGKAGTKVTTTTYTVNEKTGKVEEHVGQPVVTNATNTVVKVAAKDKVTYVKKGNDVVKVTTVYRVNETNGAITEHFSEEVVTKDGTKDKVVTENIEPKVVYSKDSTREKGSENVTEKGKAGTKVTTTTYTVNEKTGKVEEHVGQPVVTNATNTVVKVAAKDKVTYVKKGNDVVKVTTVYTVNETNGTITEQSSEEVVEQNVTSTNNTRVDGPVYSAPIGVVPTAVNNVDGDQSKVDIGSTHVVKESVLPNTGGGDSSVLSLLGGLSLTSILGLASKKRKDEE